MTITRKTVLRIVELACRAPSVHNTQPWHWLSSGGSLELLADRTRQLTTSDPEGRNLVISCGAALHHAQIAAGALGWTPTVTRLPDPLRPDLLARVELTPAAGAPSARELVEAIETRRTDRRRFTTWPVPDDRLTHLAAQATAWGTRAVPLTDVTDRFRAEMLINRAVERQLDTPPLALEQRSWVDHGTADGVPSSVLPSPADLAVRRPSRFVNGLLDDVGGSEIEGSDGLIVMHSPTDDPAAWLAAGEGLSAMWLAAVHSNLSLVPLSQVVEVEETRDALRLEVLAGLAHPLIVARVGWQAISRSELPQTPRRPVSEVLELA